MVLASPPKAAKQAERKQILRWVLYGLEEARKGAGLPEIAEDLVAVAHQNQPATGRGHLLFSWQGL